jgi:hypothetical protein
MSSSNNLTIELNTDVGQYNIFTAYTSLSKRFFNDFTLNNSSCNVVLTDSDIYLYIFLVLYFI